MQGNWSSCSSQDSWRSSHLWVWLHQNITGNSAHEEAQWIELIHQQGQARKAGRVTAEECFGLQLLVQLRARAYRCHTCFECSPRNYTFAIFARCRSYLSLFEWNRIFQEQRRPRKRAKNGQIIKWSCWQRRKQRLESHLFSDGADGDRHQSNASKHWH